MAQSYVESLSVMSWFQDHLVSSLLCIGFVVSLPILYAGLLSPSQSRNVSVIVKRCKPALFTAPRKAGPQQAKDGGPAPSAVTYISIFPPSSRPGLLRLWKALPSSQRFRLGKELSENQLQKSVLPFESDYRVADPSKYTAMGISVAEVKELGDFPNYSTLADVPLPEAYSNFRIEMAVPRPYRPFRWAYHQTMSLTKLETNWWLELDKNYEETIRLRRELFEKHGKLVLDYLPGSELACREIMEMALQFYCARHPAYFSLKHDDRDGWVFHNALLKTATVIKRYHPLHILLHNVPEDFGIMLRNPDDGHYYLRAGVLCSALGWNLNTKLGLQLRQIHDPIPDYKEKMEFSMDRFFAKMPSDRPIQRGSWGLEVDTPLFMPPGDPHEQHRARQDPSLTLDRIHLRVDWQTLRRLPLSGAIVFNFTAQFTPVPEFRDEARVPALIRRVLTQGKKSIMEYKNTWHVEHLVLPALEAYEREQVERGVVEEGWSVRTLDESPFFPGWEEKWQRQQGF